MSKEKSPRTSNNGATNTSVQAKRETMREKQDRRTMKQELCSRIDTLESRSPQNDRVSRLYAMLQSSDKGATRLNRNAKNLFNESLKMNKE